MKQSKSQIFTFSHASWALACIFRFPSFLPFLLSISLMHSGRNQMNYVHYIVSRRCTEQYLIHYTASSWSSLLYPAKRTFLRCLSSPILLFSMSSFSYPCIFSGTPGMYPDRYTNWGYFLFVFLPVPSLPPRQCTTRNHPHPHSCTQTITTARVIKLRGTVLIGQAHSPLLGYGNKKKKTSTFSHFFSSSLA